MWCMQKVWVEIFWWITKRDCDQKEGDLNWAHLFPKVSDYKEGSDIIEGDITEVRMYLVITLHLKTISSDKARVGRVTCQKH